MERNFSIKVSLCPESGRLVGTSDNIRGLVLEADTVGSLIDAARDVIPNLLKDNRQATKDDAVTISVLIGDVHSGSAGGAPSPRYVVEENDPDSVYA